MKTPTPLEQLAAQNAEYVQGRRKKAKAPAPPADLERFYRVQLRSLIRAVRREIDREVLPVIKQEKTSYTADAAWSERINAAIDRVSALFAGARYRSMMQRLAGTVVSRAEQDATRGFVKSVNGAIGVDMSPLLGDMSDFIEMSARNNASLITSLPDQYLESIRNIVTEGTIGGASPSQIQQQIIEQTGVADRRAQRIARDQTAKLTSQVTQKRQQDAGIRYYRVSTAGDERVSGKPGGKYPNAKISCWGIANKDIGYGPGVYKWSEGASWAGEKNLHPGRHHINCRCTATPLMPWEVDD